MPRTVERLPLKSPSPGTTRFLTVHRYGNRGASPKAYLHAGLHADEMPGVMALHHLIPMLDEQDAAGRIVGEIVIVAYANPIGLGQRIGGTTLGRYAFSGSGNFNRSWPDVTEAASKHLGNGLNGEPEEAIGQVRDALRRAAGELDRRTADGELLAILLSLAIDADTVLDIHCDRWSAKHLYANHRHEPDAIGLGQDMDIPAVLLWDGDDDAFEGAVEQAWWKLANHLEGAERLPAACFSATVELRGRRDVSDTLGKEDAAGLLRFLVRRGHVDGTVADQSAPNRAPYRMDKVETIASPGAGILSLRVEPGTDVEKGQVIADLIDPEADNPSDGRIEIRAGTTGFLIALSDMPQIGPGERIGMIAGRQEITEGYAGALKER